ncbi:hypothetical protein ACTTAF_06315 [Rhodobacter capsulatus]|uniref:hypothetical protein n=1 Tax=Rhodobacter capsulatus TaxID=1061 RepID=UPI0003D3AE07|nr:hypothetical protein [Rhodobacter capsulatus]ETD85760.1 hypothetical protein U703_02310 [Rhodobacter capsulatus YW1]
MRKRVDTMQKEGMTNPRQTIWTAIRDLAGEDLAGQFTVTDIVDRTGVHRKTASDYFACLVAAEYLTATADTPPVFVLRKDGGVHAPRVRRDGSAVTQGAGALNMWRSMRGLAQFSYRDIALHSTTPTVSVNEETAKSFCAMLLATGFLRVVQKADPAKARLAIYRLIRNDGPKPPQIQRVKQVFDPNTGKVYQRGAN